MTVTPGEEAERVMRAVATALQVLEEVSQRQPVGVSDLARTMAVPKSTVQRALLSLQELGWVEQESDALDRRWVQTTKLLVVSSRGGKLGLRERAMPAMRELSEHTDENVHLTVRAGLGVVVVDKLESSRRVRPIDPLGMVVPMHASSSGKAILAWSDPGLLEEVIADGLTGFTRRTLVDSDALRREVQAVRRVGYAVNRGEWNDEVRAVAAPILDIDGRAHAAVSVAVPAHRLAERDVPRLGDLVAGVVAPLSLNRGRESTPA